jgi:hypothetical protein
LGRVGGDEIWRMRGTAIWERRRSWGSHIRAGPVWISLVVPAADEDCCWSLSTRKQRSLLDRREVRDGMPFAGAGSEVDGAGAGLLGWAVLQLGVVGDLTWTLI